MIPITPRIAINEDEIDEEFIRASGPGGQNVNKLSTAVQIRFNARLSPNLPEPVRARLEGLAGRRLTKDGVIVITAQRHRTQERNRQDARERLVDLLRQACEQPTPRRATRPTLASKRRRLDSKARRATIKDQRGAPARRGLTLLETEA